MIGVLIAVARSGALATVVLVTVALFWPPAGVVAWLTVSVAALSAAVLLAAVIVGGTTAAGRRRNRK